jgi:branched-subunit amino acid transport protein
MPFIVSGRRPNDHRRAVTLSGLILVGFLPNEIWRALGLVLARGLNEDSEIVVWSRAVATAILAAVIAKLIFFPSGTLDNIPLAVRIAAAACGFVAFICIKRSVFAAVFVGEAVLLLGGFLFGR